MPKPPQLPRGFFRRAGRAGIYWRDQRGGRHRMFSRPTLKEAMDARDAMRACVAPPLPRVTVQKAAGIWLEGYVRTSRNEKGQRLAKQRVDDFLVPAMGMRQLSTVTAEHLRRYRLELHEKGLSDQTVRHVLADARTLLIWAVEAGWIPRSPFPRRLLPKIQERPPDRLTDTEVDQLVALPEPWGFYLRFLLGTGLRWGEAQRADCSHVAMGQLVVSITKTKRMRRVPLSPALLSELRGRVGRIVHVRYADSVTRQAAAVVPRFHVHMTRHTFACRFLEANGSLPALQEILGHRSIVTTQRYGRMSEETVRREAERSWG